eukprot:scaffold709_cov76-Phaeocystis_antarctica.AAC.1
MTFIPTNATIRPEYDAACFTQAGYELDQRERVKPRLQQWHVGTDFGRSCTPALPVRRRQPLAHLLRSALTRAGVDAVAIDAANDRAGAPGGSRAAIASRRDKMWELGGQQRQHTRSEWVWQPPKRRWRLWREHVVHGVPQLLVVREVLLGPHRRVERGRHILQHTHHEYHT